VFGFILGVIISAGVIVSLGSVSIQAPSLGLESATTAITMPLALSPTAIGEYFVLVFAVSPVRLLPISQKDCRHQTIRKFA
jgi:ABC-type molybdate transport system permease subunit